MHTGRCNCGAVTFEVTGDLPGPDACHCTICRKSSGHYAAGTDVKRDAVTIQGGDNITWYRSSEKVRRGFCKTCGANLFFDPLTGADWIGIMMGLFDQPTNTRLAIHIFTRDKGDYYDITDPLPQNEQ